MFQTEILGLPTHTAVLHVVTDGVHSTQMIDGLARPTVKTLLDSTNSHDESIPLPPDLTWIDFPRSYREDYGFDAQLATTYMAVVEKPQVTSDFLSAGVLISSILRMKALKEPDWRPPFAYRDLIHSFIPMPDIHSHVQYAKWWMPKFRSLDRPHPPKPPASTDVIRLLASVLSYVD